MTREEIVANASTFILAGSETTATLLSGATYHLLCNPEKLARLQNEVRTAFSSIGDISFISCSKLLFLQAVIEESLRVYPPVPFIMPRCTPPEGAIIADRWVPGNTVVGVHQWSAFHDPLNFHEPEVFAPERFLPDAPAKFQNDKVEVLQPFSIGPRNCIGQTLAYHEVRAILARIIFSFDMELCPETGNWEDQKTYVVWEKRELMVQLRNRKFKA
jgi:cytochrome P450